jgi:hypothetical protein
VVQLCGLLICRMKITPEELAKEGYTLLDKLEHNELIPFIKTYSKKKTKAARGFTLLNITFLAILSALIGFNLAKGTLSINTAILNFSYGILMSFLLIPKHELIHALAYKSQGANQTSYDANWKKFYFMAMADKFVANRNEFMIVALAPFLAITTIFIIGLLLASIPWSVTFASVILAHTAFCSGDFALLSYFEFHKDKAIVTFDDKANKISYFYSKA